MEPEPAALLRPDQERPPVPDAVQDRRLGAAEVRHPGEPRVPEPARLSLRHVGAVDALTGVSRAERQPSATQLAAPNGAGTVWLITPTTRYTACPGNSASAGLRGRRAGRPGYDGRVAVGAARGADDRVRRPHQPARSQRHQDDQARPARASSRRFDLFNLLNVSPVYAVRDQNYRHRVVHAALVDPRRPRVPAWERL